MRSNLLRIGLVPGLTGVGGMVSFQQRLADGFKARGVKVSNSLGDDLESVLVIGGTRDLLGLLKAKRRGVRVVQRLDGMNWLHRKQRTGLKHYLRSEYGNFILALIRSRLADSIVYQSQFAKIWWEQKRSVTSVADHVIYNGIDLQIYSPHGAGDRPVDCWRVLLVEGSLMGGYELGLEMAVGLVEGLQKMLIQKNVSEGIESRRIELMVVGRVSEEIKSRWQGHGGIDIRWVGLVPQEQIPEIDRSAHLLYSADLNAACPNSVIEALACGLPVLSFDTGALPEMVTGNAGRVIPYGGDPWRLDAPDIPALVEAAGDILHDQNRFRDAARQRAEEAFSLDQMVESYLDVLSESR